MWQTVKIGKETKTWGAESREETETWQQEFRCPLCGGTATYWPTMDEWNPVICDCLPRPWRLVDDPVDLSKGVSL